MGECIICFASHYLIILLYNLKCRSFRQDLRPDCLFIFSLFFEFLEFFVIPNCQKSLEDLLWKRKLWLTKSFRNIDNILIRFWI